MLNPLPTGKQQSAVVIEVDSSYDAASPNPEFTSSAFTLVNPLSVSTVATSSSWAIISTVADATL